MDSKVVYMAYSQSKPDHTSKQQSCVIYLMFVYIITLMGTKIKPIVMDKLIHF